MQRRHPTGRPSRRDRVDRELTSGRVMVGVPARHLLNPLVTIGLLGVLAVLASVPVTIHSGVVERVRDAIAAADYRVHLIAAHIRYDAVHLDGGISFGLLIVAELVGTLLVVALLIGWADRRGPRRRPARGAMFGSDRLDGTHR